MQMWIYLKYFFMVALFVLPIAVIVAQFEAPEISNVKITEVNDDSAVVEWETNIETDATVNYGLNSRHGLLRYPLHDRKEHKMTIDKLESSTTYHFRITSSDSYGNKSSSAGFVFTTEGAVDVPGVEEIEEAEERALVEKTFATLSKITSPEAIALIAEGVQKAVEKLILPPIIIGAPKITVGTDYAEISWITDRKSGSMIYFSPESEYSDGNYSFSQGNPNEFAVEHNVKIMGLEPSTTYHFKVSSEDELGLMGESEDDVFTTRSILPRIRNIQVLKIQETSAIITWNTDVPADGLVEYTNIQTGITKSAGDPTFATGHNVQLSELDFGVRYSAIIKSTNESEDEVVSEPFAFVTVRDEIAPIISKVNNESTLFPGDDVKIQTIVGWDTDELALCQFFYSQGLAGAGNDIEESLVAEINPVVNHVQVIVGLSPATVYRFWMRCADLAGNETRSEDFVLFTPQKEKSIIDIIIENFEGTFGWIKNITN